MEQLDRYERLRRRRTPAELLEEARQKSASFSAFEKDFKYMVDAMQPISAEFTANTFREGERVRNQLDKHLPSEFEAEFDFQGSVTSDTHIRIHSDIDLLALNGSFFTVDSGISPSSPYPYKQSLEDLVSMRTEASMILKREFPKVSVDDSPGKAIALEGGSLNRKVDVVIGNWWNTEIWKKYKVKMARGVRILDSKAPTTIKNKPFLHNYEIDKKDNKTLGLRKVIRLLKTLKYDAEPELRMSSYDITAVAWNMSDAALTVVEDGYLALASNALNELKNFIVDESLRNWLTVPNKTRKVFSADGAKLNDLISIHRELQNLVERIELGRPILFSGSASASLITESMLPEWREERSQVIREYSF